jgi:hypothetical protein
VPYPELLACIIYGVSTHRTYVENNELMQSSMSLLSSKCLILFYLLPRYFILLGPILTSRASGICTSDHSGGSVKMFSAEVLNNFYVNVWSRVEAKFALTCFSVLLGWTESFAFFKWKVNNFFQYIYICLRATIFQNPKGTLWTHCIYIPITVSQSVASFSVPAL